jgi:hypothetical protein
VFVQIPLPPSEAKEESKEEKAARERLQGSALTEEEKKR